MQALILAGGLGTRLRSVVSDRPKPMALINKKPFLEYLIENLRKSNVVDIVLATGYMSECIENYFKDGKEFGVNIIYAKEKEQLGTGGAIKNAEKYLQDEILILNGDTYFDIDFKGMSEFHRENKSIFTMALRKVQDVSRYGAVEFDMESKVINFVEKGKESTSSYINGGVYIVKKDILKYISPNKKISLEQEIIPKVMKLENMYAYKCENYFIDIGIPEDYLKFCNIKKEE